MPLPASAGEPLVPPAHSAANSVDLMRSSSGLTLPNAPLRTSVYPAAQDATAAGAASASVVLESVAPAQPSRLSPLRAAWLLAGLQLLGLAVVGWPAAASGYPLDDSWIFTVLARNVAEFHSWGYNPQAHTSGATSLLWTALLALNTRFLGFSSLAFSHACNALFFLVLGQLVLRLLLRAGSSATRALALSALFTCGGNVIWFAWSGMEPVLFMLLVVGSVLALPRRTAHARWLASGAPSGLLLGAAAALRPDSIAACCVLLGACAVAPRARRRGLLALAIVLAAYALNLLINAQITGSALPVTLQGRKWLEELPQHGLAPLQHMASYFVQRGFHIGANMLGLVETPVFVFVPLVLVSGLLVAVGVGGALRDVDAHATDGMGRFGLVVLFSLAHSSTYLVLFPSIGQGGRYQPLALALFGPLVFLGLEHLAQQRTQRAYVALRQPAQAALLAAFALSWPAWRSCLEQGIAVIDATHRSIAQKLTELPASARVASFDIGAIGYFGGKPIVDLGGLVDREYQSYMWSGSVDKYLLKQHIDYVVLPEYYEALPPQPNANFFYHAVDEDMEKRDSFGKRLGIADSPRVQLTPVAEAAAPRELWAFPALLTGVALPRQVLYRVTPSALAQP